MGWMGWVVVLFVLGVANWLVATLDLKKFLSLHDTIKDNDALESFKSMAKKQMYLGLLQLPLLIGMGVVGCVGIVIRQLSFLEILLFLALNGVNFALGKYSKALEAKAKSLPTEPGPMAGAYAEICARWCKAVVPDF